MEKLKRFQNIFEILVGLLILIAVGLVVFLVMTQLRPLAHESALDVSFRQYYEKADQYKRRMFDFRGVCNDIGLTEGINCVDSEEGYRVFVREGNGRYYCVDSTKYIGVIDSLPAGKLTCN